MKFIKSFAADLILKWFTAWIAAIMSFHYISAAHSFCVVAQLVRNVFNGCFQAVAIQGESRQAQDLMLRARKQQDWVRLEANWRSNSASKGVMLFHSYRMKAVLHEPATRWVSRLEEILVTFKIRFVIFTFAVNLFRGDTFVLVPFARDRQKMTGNSYGKCGNNQYSIKPAFLSRRAKVFINEISLQGSVIKW